jgi:hypothetical protein
MSYLNGGFTPGRPLQQNTAELCVINQARHSVVLERPREVGAAISGFLRGGGERQLSPRLEAGSQADASSTAADPVALAGSQTEEEVAEQRIMAAAEQRIMDAALLGRRPAGGRQPIAIVMWGGIGAGKSTASAQVLATVGVTDRSQVVDLNVDELVQSVPEFRASIGTPQEKEAYMTYRKGAKQVGVTLA